MGQLCSLSFIQVVENIQRKSKKINELMNCRTTPQLGTSQMQPRHHRQEVNTFEKIEENLPPPLGPSFISLEKGSIAVIQCCIGRQFFSPCLTDRELVCVYVAEPISYVCVFILSLQYRNIFYMKRVKCE